MVGGAATLPGMPGAGFMIFMSPESRTQPCGRGVRAATMRAGTPFPRPAGRHTCQRPRQHHRHRRPAMTWTTPSATDMRFGFEITMYVAAR